MAINNIKPITLPIGLAIQLGASSATGAVSV